MWPSTDGATRSALPSIGFVRSLYPGSGLCCISECMLDGGRKRPYESRHEPRARQLGYTRAARYQLMDDVPVYVLTSVTGAL